MGRTLTATDQFRLTAYTAFCVPDLIVYWAEKASPSVFATTTETPNGHWLLWSGSA